MRTRVGILVALLSLPLAGLAQEDAGTLHVSSRLVVLDVRVVDNQGHFVPGLGPDAFLVTEDKVPQRIRNFEGPDGHSMPTGNAEPVHGTADLPRIGNAPVNVLVIDELNTPFSDTARARQALSAFLKSQPAVLPVPTLFLASGASKVQVLHDFTQNRDDLLASMNKHVTDVDFTALKNQLAGGHLAASDGFAKTLGALDQVASSLRGIPGHKNVIWVGSGFDQAYDLTSASDSDADEIAKSVELVTRRMLEARMSLSTLDPGGLSGLDDTEAIDTGDDQAQGPSTVSNFATAVTFDSLAESTGGTVVHHRNDLSHLIAQDMRSANDYYTLSYMPTSESSKPSDYREIKIVMKDPSLHAIARTGYFSGEWDEPPVHPESKKQQTREFRYDLTSAAGSRMIYTGLQVKARPMNGSYRVTVEANGLTWKPSGEDHRLAEMSVMGVVFDGKDKPLAQDAREIKEQISTTDRVNGSQVGFDFAVKTPQNAKRVRIVVRDAASGDIGSVDLAM